MKWFNIEFNCCGFGAHNMSYASIVLSAAVILYALSRNLEALENRSFSEWRWAVNASEQLSSWPTENWWTGNIEMRPISLDERQRKTPSQPAIRARGKSTMQYNYSNSGSICCLQKHG